MNTRKWSMVILAVAACFTCLGCQPASQTLVEDSSPKPVPYKLDENSLRMRLLMTKLVQKDLHLTADQTKKLRGLYETHSARARELYEKLTEIDSPSFSEEEAERFRIQLEKSTNVQKKFETKGLAVLTPDQTERLRQIRLQTSIPEALERPEIIKTLPLSEEQLEKINALSDQMKQKWEANLRDLRKQTPPQQPQRLPKNWLDLTPPDQMASMMEFWKTSLKDTEETTNRIWDLLTTEQQTELEKLTGKRIDLTQLHDEQIKSAESYLDSAHPEMAPNPF